MLVFSLKPVTDGVTSRVYAAGQFIEMSAAHGATFVAAGNGVACPFDPLAIVLKASAAAVAAPASAKFDLAFGARGAAPAAPVGAPVTVVVTPASAGAGNPGTIQFSGGPAKSAGTVLVSVAIDATPVTGSPFTVVINKGDTNAVVGASVMAALAGVANIACTTSKNGEVIVTPKPATGALTTLTAVITGTTR